ncbi:MAG: metallophosphoesterase, partial [Pseudomonadota bacterium]
MDPHRLPFAEIEAHALPAGALWLPGARALVVSDLHLGKAERIARREGRLTPPYEAMETLGRLAALIEASRPATVVCLGDSFDDDRAAASLDDRAREALATLMAGRRWIWIAGNHDPAPPGVGGEALASARIDGIV